ncbi:helix-turn-helix transcriptional regulator [Cupriavidus necator]|uniref:helix-turn-helix transcriptional regulator n=1 Tax=Cupriavidus necator TaxID=106590 RepID=UPI00339D6441
MDVFDQLLHIGGGQNRLDAAAQALCAADLYGGWEALDAAGHANDIDRPSVARCRLDIARGQCAQRLSHLRRIHAKLGAQRRTEAVALGRERGRIL